jgi:putative glycosyltransferase
MKLSIVSTLYSSAAYIAEFHQRVSAVARQLVGEEYEIILVNDGSPDNSLDIAVQITKTDSHAVVIDLSRNFGHHKAMMTGLAQASGERIFLIDIDLEEEPEWLISFSKQMNQEKCDVVYGVQEKRKGNWFERWSGELYYRILDLMLNVPHPRNITTARLMDKRYVEALLLHKEREIVISGLWIITGFNQHSQIVRKKSRSKTSYNLFHKFSHLTNVVTSFSIKPLMGIFFTGLALSILSFIYAFFLAVNRFFFYKPLAGWTSVMVSVWLLGGIIISFIGVVGIYLAKIFIETKQRPYTIIKDIYDGSKQ